jgi:hypothetical protein
MENNEIKEILKKLDEHEKRINVLEEQIKSSTTEKRLNGDKNRDSEFPHDLCERLGINEIQLGHILYYEDDLLEFVCPIEGKSNAEKQFNGTIIILTFYHFWKNVNKIKSQELRKILQKEKKLSLNNFSTNLKKNEYMKYIRPDGVNGSHEFSYKITNPLGIEKGLEIIKNLISVEESSEESS